MFWLSCVYPQKKKNTKQSAVCKYTIHFALKKTKRLEKQINGQTWFKDVSNCSVKIGLLFQIPEIDVLRNKIIVLHNEI